MPSRHEAKYNRRFDFVARAAAAGAVAVLLAAGSAAAQATMQPELIDVVREELTFESRGVKLAATLHRPKTAGPHPAIVTAHGSGHVTRRGAYISEIANWFPPRGVAVLAFDKRGVGQSEGVYPGSWGSSMIIYAMDVLAGVHYLKSRRDIDNDHIGLWGMSQAGWIIPIAAVCSQGDVAFTIIVSGPTVSIGEENHYSELTGLDAGRPSNMPPEEIDRLVAERGSLGFDHYPLIIEMTRPALWIFGELDMSVPVRASVRDLQEIKAEWNRDFTWKVFPNANHGLRISKTGGTWERPVPRKPVAGYFTTMAAWLESHAGLKGRLIRSK